MGTVVYCVYRKKKINKEFATASPQKTRDSQNKCYSFSGYGKEGKDLSKL